MTDRTPTSDGAQEPCPYCNGAGCLPCGGRGTVGPRFRSNRGLPPYRTPTSDPVAAALTAEEEAEYREHHASGVYSRNSAIVRLLATLDRDREAIRQQARAVAAQVRADLNKTFDAEDGQGYRLAIMAEDGGIIPPPLPQEFIDALLGGESLAASPEPASSGSGLREALLRIYDLSMADGISARLDIREVAGAALAARPDGAEADAS